MKRCTTDATMQAPARNCTGASLDAAKTMVPNWPVPAPALYNARVSTEGRLVGELTTAPAVPSATGGAPK